MTDVAGVMTDDNGLYYMRARYYNVNIKRFINQDVVHGSINVSQSLNRYSYVQGNPIKLTDPFGLSPLDRLNWKNLGHAILNGLGLIPVIGEAFDIANAIWYAHDGEYGMAVLSMMSALPMIGNIASGIMTAAKITTAAKIVSTVCKVVSNAATFTQAAIGGVNNAKAIVKNMINGKLFSEDTAKNLVSFGINAFTAATSGKNLLSSSKELKKVVGDSVGSKWGKKAKKEPLLECNLQFFADKSGNKTEVIMPSKPHTNRTSGHWKTILDEVDIMKNSGDYSKVYVNKGLSNEIPGANPNRRPDIMGVRNNGLIDQVEVPSKTDIPDLLIDRMVDNQRIMGDRAGTIKIRNIGDN